MDTPNALWLPHNRRPRACVVNLYPPRHSCESLGKRGCFGRNPRNVCCFRYRKHMEALWSTYFVGGQFPDRQIQRETWFQQLSVSTTRLGPLGTRHTHLIHTGTSDSHRQRLQTHHEHLMLKHHTLHIPSLTLAHALDGAPQPMFLQFLLRASVLQFFMIHHTLGGQFLPLCVFDEIAMLASVSTSPSGCDVGSWKTPCPRSLQTSHLLAG